MSNSSEVDVESINRLHTNPGRSVLSPDVVRVDLSFGRGRPGEELPFAPAPEPVSPEADPEKSLIALAATFRWRRPLLVVLAIAVAVSAALAARRNSTVDNDARASGAMSAPDIDGAPSGPSTGGGEPSSEGSDDGSPREAAGGEPAMESEVESEMVDSSDTGAAPLQVTTRSWTTGTPTTSRAGSSTAAVQAETTARTSTTAPATTSTGRVTTSERTTTTGQATTWQTTTQQSTTGQATTWQTTSTRATATEPSTGQTATTLVLVGWSAGGFESPSIRQDMVWLDNGEVDGWSSTNGDIQLMRSGFEGIASVDGGQYAELNSSSQAGLYRSLTVEPGSVIEWAFLHRARSGTERIEIRIGPRSSQQVVDTVQAETQWVTHSGAWRVPDGVTSVRFMLWSTETGPYGNLVDAVRVVATEP